MGIVPHPCRRSHRRAALPDPPALSCPSDEQMTRLLVNGTAREVDAETEIPLLWVLRDELGLTGTKFGCGVGYCGACTVEIDGVATRSCVTPCSSVQGRSVRTIEGEP